MSFQAWGSSMTSRAEKPWPSGISDDEQAFVVPYLALIRADALRSTLTHSSRACPPYPSLTLFTRPDRWTLVGSRRRAMSITLPSTTIVPCPLSSQAFLFQYHE